MSAEERKTTFWQRLNERYEKLKGYVWDGYKAPEQRPRIKSSQVTAVAEELFDLDERFTQFEIECRRLARIIADDNVFDRVKTLEARVKVLEDLRDIEQKINKAVIDNLYKGDK